MGLAEAAMLHIDNNVEEEETPQQEMILLPSRKNSMHEHSLKALMSSGYRNSFMDNVNSCKNCAYARGELSIKCGIFNQLVNPNFRCNSLLTVNN